MILERRNVTLTTVRPSDFARTSQPGSVLDDLVGQFSDESDPSWSHLLSRRKFLLMRSEPDEDPIGIISHTESILGSANTEIGFQVFERNARSENVTLESIELMVDYLFMTKPFERIQSIARKDDTLSQRILERGGFRQEGVMRRARFVDGAYRDYLLFSILRGEWTNKRQESVQVSDVIMDPDLRLPLGWRRYWHRN